LNITYYLQAKSLAEPFAYEEYRKSKIREKIEAERANRVVVKVREPYLFIVFAKNFFLPIIVSQ
jgi:ribosome biogenesis protein ENP2